MGFFDFLQSDTKEKEEEQRKNQEIERIRAENDALKKKHVESLEKEIQTLQTYEKEKSEREKDFLRRKNEKIMDLTIAIINKLNQPPPPSLPPPPRKDSNEHTMFFVAALIVFVALFLFAPRGNSGANEHYEGKTLALTHHIEKTKEEVQKMKEDNSNIRQQNDKLIAALLENEEKKKSNTKKEIFETTEMLQKEKNEKEKFLAILEEQQKQINMLLKHNAETEKNKMKPEKMMNNLDITAKTAEPQIMDIKMLKEAQRVFSILANYKLDEEKEGDYLH